MKRDKFLEKIKIEEILLDYLIENGFILPNMKDGDFDFDDDDKSEVKTYLHLKEMGFTELEIKKSIVLMRIAFHPLERTIYFKRLMTAIKNRTSADHEYELTFLNKKLGFFDKLIDNLEPIQLGLPVKLLNKLSCPDGGEEFQLEEPEIKNNYIISGELKCNTNHIIKIENGIIINKEKSTINEDHTSYSEKIINDIDNKKDLVEYDKLSLA